MTNCRGGVLSANILYGWDGLLRHGDWHKNWAGDKDFKKNEEAARVWGERKFINWKKILENHEMIAISKYTDSSTKLNYYLRENKGIVDEQGELEDRSWKDYQDYNKQISNIDSALRKNKTEKVMHVYRRVDERYFYSVAKILEESLKLRNFKNEIKQSVFFRIISDFIFNKIEYQDHAYVSTSLSGDPAAVEDGFGHKPILLKIKVPKNTNACYLGFEELNKDFFGEREILIRRGYRFKYQDAKIINDKYGRQTVLVILDLMLPYN